MRATIITDDNKVIVDGMARDVDCAALSDIHAVQWYGSFGEEEYRTTIDPDTKEFTRQPNTKFDDMSKYQTYLDAWSVENKKQTLIETAEKARIEKVKGQMEAFNRLPPDLREQVIAERTKKMEEEQKIADEKRIAEWKKLPPAEQQRLLSEARG